MAIYIALIHKDSSSDYGVSFPDLPGCVTVGSTLEEARANAVEALGLHMEGMIEDKAKIPAPSDLDAIAASPDYKTAMATTAIEVAMRAPKSVRVNITIPEDTLAEIDAYAETSGTTRSGLIATATRKFIRVA
jgi:predicted RNase H-like HicB family nuclease